MGFGKSKQKSENTSQQTSSSYNQAYPFLQSQLGDQVGQVSSGNNAIASLLGLNGSGAGSEAFDTFRNSSGYNFIRDEGLAGLTANNATRGLLNSGSALTGAANYSSKLASNFLNSYLSNLSGLSNSGLQASQVLAGAGNTANSQGTSYGTSSGKSFNASLG